MYPFVSCGPCELRTAKQQSTCFKVATMVTRPHTSVEFANSLLDGKPNSPLWLWSPNILSTCIFADKCRGSVQNTLPTPAIYLCNRGMDVMSWSFQKKVTIVGVAEDGSTLSEKVDDVNVVSS